MLIVNQTKDLVVNMDNVSYINIEKKTLSIKACLAVFSGNELMPSPKVHLGTYQSLDDCKKVLREMISYNTDLCRYYEMPLGGAVR